MKIREEDMFTIKDLVDDFESKIGLIQDCRVDRIKKELIKAGLNNEQAEFFAMLCDDLESAGFNRGYQTALEILDDSY